MGEAGEDMTTPRTAGRGQDKGPRPRASSCRHGHRPVRGSSRTSIPGRHGRNPAGPAATVVACPVDRSSVVTLRGASPYCSATTQASRSGPPAVGPRRRPGSAGASRPPPSRGSRSCRAGRPARSSAGGPGQATYSASRRSCSAARNRAGHPVAANLVSSAGRRASPSGPMPQSAPELGRPPAAAPVAIQLVPGRDDGRPRLRRDRGDVPPAQSGPAGSVPAAQALRQADYRFDRRAPRPSADGRPGWSRPGTHRSPGGTARRGRASTSWGPSPGPAGPRVRSSGNAR